MSDYTDQNISRSDGVSAKGLIVAAAVLVGLLVLMSFIGGGSGSPEGAAGDAAVPIAPATDDAVPAPAAPAVSE